MFSNGEKISSLFDELFNTKVVVKIANQPFKKTIVNEKFLERQRGATTQW